MVFVHTVNSGFFRLDGGSMFGVVPKVLWQKTNPADDLNRIKLAMRLMVVRSQAQVLVVDAGSGEPWDEKAKQIYAMDFSNEEVKSEFQKLGIALDDVTDVVLSHLHFDHLGGIDLFPRATVHVHRANYDHSRRPSDRDRASFHGAQVEKLVARKNVKIWDGPAEIAAGVSTWITHGHTPGHQLVKVQTDAETYLFCGDTIPTSSHVHLPYIAAFDLHPLTVLAEKAEILKQAVAGNWTLIWAHDPEIPASRIKFEGGRYSAGSTVQL